jgi:hypothetical protein
MAKAKPNAPREALETMISKDFIEKLKQKECKNCKHWGDASPDENRRPCKSLDVNCRTSLIVDFSPDFGCRFWESV